MDKNDFEDEYYRVNVEFDPDNYPTVDGAVTLTVDGTATHTFMKSGFYNIPVTYDSTYLASISEILLTGVDGTAYKFVGFDSDTASVLIHNTTGGERGFSTTAYFMSKDDFEKNFYRVNVEFDPDNYPTVDGTVDLIVDGTATYTFVKTSFYNVPKTDSLGAAIVINRIVLTGVDGTDYMFVGFDTNTASDLIHAVGAEKEFSTTANFMSKDDFEKYFYRVNADFDPDNYPTVDGKVTLTVDGTLTHTFLKTGFYNIPVTYDPSNLASISVIKLTGVDGTAYKFVGFDSSYVSLLIHKVVAGENSFDTIAHFNDKGTFESSYYRVNVTFDPTGADGTVDVSSNGTVYGTLPESGFVNVANDGTANQRISIAGMDGTTYTFLSVDITPVGQTPYATSYASPTTVAADNLNVIAHFLDKTTFERDYNRVNIILSPDNGSGSVRVADSKTDKVFGTLFVSGFVNVPKTSVAVDLLALDPAANPFDSTTPTQFMNYSVTSDVSGVNPLFSFANPYTVSLLNDMSVTAYFTDKVTYDYLYYRIDVNIEPNRTGSVEITGSDSVVYGKLYKDGYINVAKTVSLLTIQADPTVAPYLFKEYRVGDTYNTAVNPLTVPVSDLIISNNYGVLTAYFTIIPPEPYSYYITSKTDAGATIDPLGVIVKKRGENQTFYFAAKDGFTILEVWIDGLRLLTPEEMNLGQYTFTDIMANHTIEVKTNASLRTDVILTITVKNGDGYAEYNANNSGFVKYTGTVYLPTGSSLVVRAVAGDGFWFDHWETPTIVKDPTMSFSNLRGPLSLDLYFTDQADVPIEKNNLLWWVLLLLAILAGMILFFIIWVKPGLFVTVIVKGDPIQGVEIAYTVGRGGKVKKDNGLKPTNKKGECWIPARKDSTITITMAVYEGKVATNLPAVVVMESRREYVELLFD